MTRLEYSKRQKMEYASNRNKKIDLIINSDIDFSVYGWVSKTARLIDIAPQRINRWMKQYMSDFYIT